MNQFVEKSIERFWKLWSAEYLGSLCEQHSYIKNKNLLERDMICVGHIVLVSESTPRIKSKYRLVEELIQENDRKIRGTCVLINNKNSKDMIRRPINKF